MSYDIHFEMKSGYLFVRVTGENSTENVHAYMQDVLEHCSERDCFRVLGQFDAVAYVDEEMGEMADFAETVAVNQGMPLRMFSNLQEATRWIGEQDEDSDSQNIFTGNVDGKPQFRA